MATKKAKKEEPVKAAPAKAGKMSEDEKKAKRKARMEALKNRPAGQRPNSKQIDVIEGANGTVVKNYGYTVKTKNNILGVLVTSVAYDENGNVLSSSTTFVPGNVTVKAKKGHGGFSKPKTKGEKNEDEAEDEDED